MVNLLDRQIKGAAILCHRKMDVVIVNFPLLKCQRLRFAQPGKQQELIVDPVNWIVEIVHLPAPSLEIINDDSLEPLFKPLD